MKKYILLGCLTFIISLLAFIPASIASKVLPEHIVAQGYHGNIWEGTASSLKINNVDVGTVSWQIHSSCFLLFKLCADIDQRHTDINSTFLLKARSATELHDVKAAGNTAMLSGLFGQYGITPSGSFEADLPKVEFSNDKVESIEGHLQFSSLVLNGVLRIAMGNVDSVFEPKQDHTHIQVSNNQGHVDLAGSVQLFTDMSYEVDMKIRHNDKSSEAVKNGMQYVGKAQSDGSVRLKQSGKLTI